MEWSLETVKILVENVQKYPVLYDGTAHFKNSKETQEAWDMIAKTIGNDATGFLCKQRWQSLRGAYRNHLKVGSKVTPVGIEHHLKFMAPFFRTKAELQSKRFPRHSLDFCTKLTQIVKEFPHLHFDNQPNDDWQHVATRMGTGDTPEQCRYHWSRLRDRYSYHLKQGCMVKPLGIEEHLTFLAPLIAIREEASLESTKKLINLVRQNPILYEAQTNSNEQQAVWEKVAERLDNGATAQVCEANWRSLRTAYTNCLQKGYAMRQIGIVDHLNFLKPYLKLPKVEPKSEPEPKRIRLNETQQKRNAAVAAAVRHKHLRIDADDEDTLFLFEFLPDVAKMNDAEKMSFKLGAMSLIEEIRCS